MTTNSPKPTDLDINKDYTWFLSDIEIRKVKDFDTVVFTWACVEKEIEVKEYLRVTSPLAGSRLYDLMSRLGWTKSPEETNIKDVHKFFERGMRITAKPLKYWGELNSEQLTWKLNYDTIVNASSRALSSMTQQEIDRLITFAQRYPTYNEALSKVASNAPDKIEAFLELYKMGKIKFGSSSQKS